MRKAAFYLLALMACLLMGGRTFAQSVGTPTGIGTAGNTTNSTSLSISATKAVGATNTIIVTLVLYNNSGPVTVTDSGLNSYAPNADVTDAFGVRTLVFSAPVATALTTSSTIAANFNANVQYKNASAFYVSGLVAASPADRTATATNATAPAVSVGPTATTSQANELLIGAFGVNDGGSTASFTAGTGYTALPSNVTGSGLAIFPEYRIVAATGAYSATGTLGGTHSDWSGAIVTYKAGTAQTITFPSPGNQIYGVTPIMLGATASSGLTVTYTVTSGPATVAGNVLTITGAGTVTIQASQAGNGTYRPATPVSQTITVAKATPIISGVTGSQSISYGTAAVNLSGTVSAGAGYPTNGETVSVTINGSPQSATIAGGAGGFSVSFPTATIPPSPTAYTITYAYVGDANLNAATNNTSTTLTVTGISVPNLSYTNATGIGLRILLSDITGNTGTKSSLSSPSYAITGVSASSTQGGTVVNNSTTILYTPPNNTITNDTFTYTLTDGTASKTATVTVTFVSPTGPTLAITLDGSNHPVIKFYGILGQGYHIQRAPTPTGSWADVQAVTIPGTGDGSDTWTDTGVTGSANYYRLRYP